AQDVSTATRRTDVVTPFETIVRTGNRPVNSFPDWSMPGFRGIVRKDDGSHYFAGHAAAGTGDRFTEVFAYEKLDKRTLAELLPGIASVMLISGEDLQFKVGQYGNPSVKLVLDSEDIAPPPKARGFWDLALESPLPQRVRSMESGGATSEVFV